MLARCEIRNVENFRRLSLIPRVRQMASEREIYRSSNGDRWLLCHDGDRVMVLHRANEASGGKATPIELVAFLREGNAGPEHQALAHMIGTLADA